MSRNEPVVRSVYDNQDDILNGIIRLHCPSGFECDITYGNGKFYKDEAFSPRWKFDIDPQLPGVIKACSTDLPFSDNTRSSIVFDPPFLTYVRQNRQGNGNMIMANRFSGYWSYRDLETHYKLTLEETFRCLRKGGVLVFKCQDIIHNHRMHCTHVNVINWADEIGFKFKDLFILSAKHRLPSPNRAGKQKHARIFHSYFLVFQK